MHAIVSRSVVCAVALAMAAGRLHAQETRGTISGIISDPTGAAIPDVKVTALHTATGMAVSGETNPRGDYLLPYLPSGVYKLTAEARGFRTYVNPGVEVRIGDRLQIDIRMSLGEQAERITVAAETPLLETTSSSFGQVIEQRWLNDLPVLHGNPMLLTQLAPGVTFTGDSVTWVSTSTGANANNTLYSMGGSATSTQEVTLDGASNTTTSAGAGSGMRTVAFIPPSDLIAEFKVQTAGFDASLGASTGGWVSTSLKSGTNDLHGSAFYSRTNSGWNANDFFANRVGQSRAYIGSNHQVLTSSGPVWLPKLYKGRDRTFFLYGWKREMRAAPFANSMFSVPTVQQRKGDFSDLLAVSSAYQIYNPYSGTLVNGRISRQPFPGNVLPPSLLNPIALKILDYYPLPLTTGLSDFTQNYPQPNLLSIVTIQSHTARVDHNLSARHRAFARAYWSERPTLANDNFGNLATGVKSMFANRGAMLDDVYTLSPNAVLNVRYSFTRFFYTNLPKSLGMDLTALGFPASLVQEIGPDNTSFPTISITGLTALGSTSSASGGTYTNTHQLSAQVDLVRGKHVIKIGADHRRYQRNEYSLSGETPTINFTNAYTKGPLDNSPGSPGSVGQAFASFLLGRPASGSIWLNDSYAQSSPYTAAYVQDDWRVARPLTLNLGVRWEYEGALSERYDRSVRGFDTQTVNPLNAQVRANYAANPIPELPVDQFVVKGGLLFAGRNGQPHSLYSTGKRNFAPRIGLAWQLGSKTVIRTGYGIFYGFTGEQGRTQVIQTGFRQSTTLLSSLDGGLQIVGTISNPFPNGLLRPTGASRGLDTYLGESVSFLNSNPLTPYNQIWSFSLQRVLAGRLMFEAAYFGNRGVHLKTNRSLQYFDDKYLSRSSVRDQASIDYWSARVPNPFYPLLTGTSLTASMLTRAAVAEMANYPQFTGVSTTDNAGSSWYHALYGRLQKRFGQGFTMQFSYTFSKRFDALTRLNGQTSPLERVIGSGDRARNATFNGIYELPFGEGKPFRPANKTARLLASRWQLGVIVTAQSGVPLGFGDAVMLAGMGAVPLASGDRTIDRWFNTAAFNRITAQQFQAYHYQSLSSRFSGVRGPSRTMWNASLSKTIQLWERLRLLLKADCANVFNHPNFAVPNTAPTSAAFGRISATSAMARMLQLGAKVQW